MSAAKGNKMFKRNKKIVLTTVRPKAPKPPSRLVTLGYIVAGMLLGPLTFTIIGVVYFHG